MGKTNKSGERLFSIFPYRGPEMALHTLRQEGALFMAIHIPWDMIAPHEEQAIINTRYSLKQLDERGGLHAGAVVAILEDRPETEMSPSEANMQLLRLWMKFEEERKSAASQKPRVRLLKEGKLSGGLTVPVGTICTVDHRNDENDFYSKGRATLDVLMNDIMLFTVFEDEVEYL